jgi:hypothetical protein
VEAAAHNQFHDILPGSSIKEVYETTIPQLTRLQQPSMKQPPSGPAHSWLPHSKAAEDVLFSYTLDFVRNDLCTTKLLRIAAFMTRPAGVFLPASKAQNSISSLQSTVQGWKRYRLEMTR